ncbi:tyrosine/DOPA decarboxylase [Spatholobus suberectus]|nr:tyrosine/DOPA decarboxylase [Spatholobus suberectus]
MEFYCKSLKLNIDVTKPTKFFVCNNLVNCRNRSPVLLSSFKNKRCRCGDMLGKSISPRSSDVFDGFVKSGATLVVTDNLKVVPDSLDTIFYQFKNCGIENMSSPNEMTMTITKNEQTSAREHAQLWSWLIPYISETKNNSKGYAKGPTMCMAIDDLVVTPMSSLSVVSLLNSMNILFSDLGEEVSIGTEEVTLWPKAI